MNINSDFRNRIFFDFPKRIISAIKEKITSLFIRTQPVYDQESKQRAIERAKADLEYYKNLSDRPQSHQKKLESIEAQLAAQISDKKLSKQIQQIEKLIRSHEKKLAKASQTFKRLDQIDQDIQSLTKCLYTLRDSKFWLR